MANINIPIYDVCIDDEQIGLTAVSFVDEPAIMEDFIAFSAEDKMLWLSSHEKREVVSPILIPNQLILRKNAEGQLYYIRWTEEAIQNAAAKFLANGFWNNVTIMHPTFYNKDMKYTDALEKDVYLLRMWIVQDAATDDINTKYGFKGLPNGTLCVHYKVHNRQLWSRIKSGELRGLSIECMTNVIKSNNDVKLNINMNKLDVTNKQLNLFQKFIAFMNEVSAEAEEIADIAKKDDTESGDVSLKYFIDNDHFIEVDAEGFARDEEFNLVAEGKYLLADGNYLIVDGENKFVGTEAGSDIKTDDENAPVEAPIAEEKLKDEDDKEDEETEKTEGEADGEAESEPIDTESEDNADGTEEVGEGTDEEDEKKRRVANAELDDKDEEEVPTVEEPSEEVPLTLVPFLIDGVEYQLPQEVVDYINSLVSANEASMNELSLMKERIPSATPIPSVINQSAEGDETDGLFEAIRLLNRKR